MLSPRVLRTLAAFGVGVRRLRRDESPAGITRDDVVRAIVRSVGKRGSVTLLTGMSGCGKSTHMRAARLAVVKQGFATRLLDLGKWAGRAEAASVLDCVRCRCDEALDLLNAVGLADALLLAQDSNTLSEGQSARLRIAAALAMLLRRRKDNGHHRSHAVLFIDEFASVLDRATARALCIALARLTRSKGRAISVVVATAHDDVRDWLSPDVTVKFDSWGEVCVERNE